MAPNRKPTTEELAEQLRAIRAFFTEPKDTYTEAEILRLFAGERPHDDCSGDRATVADFLFSYVSPGIVGRACVGTESELSLDVVQVELPRWLVKVLRKTAGGRGESISDVIATEYRDRIEGCWFDEIGHSLPKYDAVVLTSAERSAS